MKKSVFDLVRYANHVLFFGFMLAFFGTFIVQHINTYQRQKQQQQRLEQMRNSPSLPIEDGATVAESSDSQQATAMAEPVDYKVELLQKVEDVYVFQIINDHIDTRIKHQNTAALETEYQPRDYVVMYADVEQKRMVNLMFSREGQPSRMLLQRDALIYNASLKRNNQRSPQQSLNIYMIMTEDSNGDDRLGRGDQIDLYSSAYDGSGLRLAMQDINSYDLIGDDRLLVTRQQAEQQTFHLLDLQSNEYQQLDTSISTQLE